MASSLSSSSKIVTLSTNNLSLTVEQEAFLNECEKEFESRYTDADKDFSKIWAGETPLPPIMYPWYTRRFNNYIKPGSSRDGEDGPEKFRKYGPIWKNDNRFRPY